MIHAQTAPGLELTACQRSALQALEGVENLFLTGSAGTGKSFLIQHFLRARDRGRFPVVASTGAAAVLVGGRTFHSFFGLGVLQGGPDATIERALRDRKLRRRLGEIEGFVLDEVSMIPGATLRAAEAIARGLRDSDRPWGGLRVVAVGDFCQLPPVTRSGLRDWAFADPVWAASRFRPVVLRTIMRTQDEALITVLGRIRAGRVDATVSAYLDSKHVEPEDEGAGTRLFARRAVTEAYNAYRLEQVPGEARRFPTAFNGRELFVEQLRKHLPIADEVLLKPGAQVMIRVNDPRQRYVNGSIGVVERIEDDALTVRLATGRAVELGRATFSLLDADGDEVAWAVNFPVALAYATTIHKAQGATLERVRLDLRALWEPGQAYVALSRVASGDGLAIEAWQAQAIKVDPEVVAFNAALDLR